jgi:[acyl-carrier-protein] S-malonyltransferase
MGRDFYERYPEVRPIFESEVAGFDLREVCFGSQTDLLNETRYTQPCMAAFAAAVVLLCRQNGLHPDAVAGLSLGEYSALHAAEVFDAETLLRITATRGRLMSDAAQGIDTRMLAVIGLSDDEVRAAVAQTHEQGFDTVYTANFNCPGQVVIAGTAEAVAAAETLCKEHGARRCLPLATSGPFHTPLIAGVAPELARALADTPFKPLQTPLVSNVTGDFSTDEQLAELLTRQGSEPVLFARSIETLAAAGVEHVIEIGPGKALSGFVRRTAPTMTTHTLETVEDFKELIAV